MRYIQVENNNPINYYENKPRWFHDDKSEVSDKWLKDNENIYPLFEEHENDYKFIGKPSLDWDYQEDCVIKTYFNVIDVYPSKDNYITQKYVINNESEWITDGDVIKRTYRVEDRTDGEIEIFLVNKICYEESKNPDEWLLKPSSMWEYSNDIVYKTYWKIIIPNEIDNIYAGIFKKLTRKSSSEWKILSEESVEVTYDVSDNTLEEVKENFINSVHTFRYWIETGGIIIDIDGKVENIQTDRESQSKLTSIFLQNKYGVMSDGIEWKTENGFISLSSKNIDIVFNKIQEMIQKAFKIEKELVSLIENTKNIDECKNLFGKVLDISYIEESKYFKSINKESLWQFI